MRRELLSFIAIVALALTAAGCAASDSKRETTARKNSTTAPATQQSPATPPNVTSAHESAAQQHDDGHGHARLPARVPAFEVSPAALKNLPPTLSPELFTGKTREAYQVVKEIPETIAQLPCYCHCDQGFGHKSLHSCFSGEDRHASQCAVCVEEALVAYRMQKEEKLTPAQIRERIVAHYTSQGF
jgi:hypothetical protein